MTLPLTAVLATVFAALLMVSLLLIGMLRGGERSRNLMNQFDQYGPRHAPAPAADLSEDGGEGEGGVARAAVGLASQVLRTSNAERGLALRLDLAGIRRTPAEWVLLGAGACAGLAGLLALLFGNALIGVPAGLLLGWLGMRVLVSSRIRRRRATFSDQLPDVLQLMAGSLRSGFSLAQSLDAVVREDTQPASDEFFRAIAETRVGIDLDVALDGVASRMDSTDLRWTVMAIRIQREVGGNLAEILGNTISTMRERAALHRHVRALSAEGRLSAWILIALPLAIGGYLFLTDRSYLSPLFHTVLGILLLAGAGVLFVIGVFWMRAAIKVEV
ncbi:MAG TPA: type II secretion system F family protein [Streptosporangiaceae bacterium]|jgi:tight adherence protein B|nr:type II secretion system F family protein [Streptosporangiaceae bacterium]